MDAHILNKLSKLKNTFIESCLTRDVDRFEIAASLQKWLEEVDSNYKPELLFASGPKELFNLFAKHNVKKQDLTLHSRFKKARLTNAEKCLSISKDVLSLTEELELRKMIFWDLNFQLSQAIYSQIERSVKWRECLGNFDIVSCSGVNFGDLDWIGYYALIKEAFNSDIHIEHEALDLLENGAFQIFLFESHCIVLLKPVEICRNQNLVLHNEEGPAVLWADGTGIYYWNGIEVSQQLIEEPESITREIILQEQNVEVRRCMQEALGSEKFANLLGLTPLDIQADRFGNQMILYRTQEPDKLIGEHIHFAKVICPTTGRNYFLCVPPTIRSVSEAVAWTFGKSRKEYNPEKET